MCSNELRDLTEAINILSKKIDRLTQTMLPTPDETSKDLDRVKYEIQKYGLNPVEALTKAGFFKKKRRYRKRKKQE